MTLPQLSYYLKQIDEHVEFTIKVQTMGLSSLFGGTSEASKKDNETRIVDGEVYEGEYKVATAEDMEWLASIL